MFRYLATVLNKGTGNGAASGPQRLNVRVDGPICGKLCPPVAVAGQRLRVVRAGGTGALARGEQLVLRPAEAARLLRRAGHDPRGAALRSAFLEARVMPHLGGRLAYLALRGGSESILDLRPLAGMEGCAFEPGGLYDALAAWREPVSTWASRYRMTRRAAGEVLVSGGADGVRFRRRMHLLGGAPIALVETTVHPASRKGKPGAPRPARSVAARAYAACFALRVPGTGLWFKLPDGERCVDWRALPDPPVLHPFHSGDRVEPRLPVGAFACAAEGQGGTLVLFDPQAAVRVELVGQRHRVRVRLRFPPRRPTDGPCAVALAVCDRVAASPHGVAGAAAKAPDRQGRVRVAVLVRETVTADERVSASVGGRTWPLLSRDLGAAGTVRAGVLSVSADAWRREPLVVTTPRGGYKL